jgi:uncharacterized tellurite resistance protein B-like protein
VLSAITVIAADGVLAGEENKLLQMYRDTFGVSEAKLTPIIERIAIRMISQPSHNPLFF